DEPSHRLEIAAHECQSDPRRVEVGPVALHPVRRRRLLQTSRFVVVTEAGAGERADQQRARVPDARGHRVRRHRRLGPVLQSTTSKRRSAHARPRSNSPRANATMPHAPQACDRSSGSPTFSATSVACRADSAPSPGFHHVHAELAYETAQRSGMWRKRPDKDLVDGWIERVAGTDAETPARAKALIAH